MVELDMHYHPTADCHNYGVGLETGSNSFVWRFPSGQQPTQCLFTYQAASHAPFFYGPPPSPELRTLIEADAPWYVVLDKLSEEYPQWQPHFDKATAEQYAG